jgi:hypothetical protein
MLWPHRAMVDTQPLAWKKNSQTGGVGGKGRVKECGGTTGRINRIKNATKQTAECTKSRNTGTGLQVVDDGGHVGLLVVAQAEVVAVAEPGPREIKGKHAYVFGEKHRDY